MKYFTSVNDVYNPQDLANLGIQLKKNPFEFQETIYVSIILEIH